MFFKSVIKIYSRLFQKCSTKRPRNPTTFQECMEKPQQYCVLWKMILFIPLLLPTIYFMLYFRRYSDSLDAYDDGFYGHKTATDSVTDEDTEQQNTEENKPVKAKYTIRNSEVYAPSSEEFARFWGVEMGGYYVPKDCRPRYKVAILVPYLFNRQKNLHTFLRYMHPFLIRQKLEYRIFVIEQDGSASFNKGRLFNAGFLEIQRNGNWQCVIFHDVDLLPTDNRIRYTCPVLPRHMCAVVSGKENVVKYNTVFGGVTAMTMWHYKRANGYSNFYWGKGESEDMFKRLQAAGLGVTRYNKNIAKYLSLKHPYRADNPNRTELLATAMKRYKNDGLSSLKYDLVSYGSNFLYTHFVVNIEYKTPPDYITEVAVTLLP